MRIYDVEIVYTNRTRSFGQVTARNRAHALQRIAAQLDAAEYGRKDPATVTLAAAGKSFRAAPGPRLYGMLDPVSVTIGGTPCPRPIPLADFLDANDGFEAVEITAIRAALARGEVYRGGGGAAPEFSIERAAP